MKHSEHLSVSTRLRALFGSSKPEAGTPPSFGTPEQAPPAAGLHSTPIPPDDAEPVSEETPRPGRFDPGRSGVRALVVVGLLAALIAGGYLWWSRPRPRHVPAAAVRTESTVRPAADTSAEPSPSPSTLMVDVVGKVRHPGVVTLPADARVIDAIKAAGGVKKGADTGTLNLAAHVTDGQQILVGIGPDGHHVSGRRVYRVRRSRRYSRGRGRSPTGG